MRVSKSIESSIGIASIILALSSFVDSFKTIYLGKVLGVRITVYEMYLTYALLFVVYVLFQSYYEAFLEKVSNVQKRRSYFKLLNFAYYIVLTFIPIAALNILIIRIFFDEHLETTKGGSDNWQFFISVIFFCVMVYLSDYRLKFKDFEQQEKIRLELNRDVKLISFLLEENDLKALALLQYDIAKKYLLFLTRKTTADIGGFSITDCIVDAYKQSKITGEQKENFERIAAVRDTAHFEFTDLQSKNYKKNLVTNNWFLEEEIHSL